MSGRARGGDRTLVVGGYGYGNLGAEAILAGLLTSIDRNRVTVVSRDPRETSRLHGVRAIPLARAPVAAASHKSLLIGGGGLFGRDMSRIGRLLPIAGELGGRLGRRVRIRGLGLDRQMPPLQAKFVGRLLRVADEVTVRDRESVEVARELGVAAELAPDLSTLLAPAGPAEAIRALAGTGADPSRPVVILTLTAIDPVLAGKVERAIAQVVAARPDLAFVALPMSRDSSVPSHDDRVLASRLIRRVPPIRLLAVDDPALALAVIGLSAAVVAMRYHSLLFADRMGVPIVAVPYAEKCRHWLVERRQVPVTPDAEGIGSGLTRALRGIAQRWAS